jgi:hypothetical protein
MSVQAVNHTASAPAQHAQAAAPRPAPVKSESHAPTTATRGQKVNQTA